MAHTTESTDQDLSQINHCPAAASYG